MDYEIPKSPVVIRRGHEFFSEWLEYTLEPAEGIGGRPTYTWAGFNEHFGGARPELVLVSGETGRGKTTWVLNWFKDTLDQGRPSLIMPFEMGPMDTISCLGQMVLGKWRNEIGDEDREKFGKTLEKWPIHVLDHYGMLKQEWVESAIHLGVREYKVQFVVIDHLEYIEKRFGSRNEAYVIDDCVRWLAGIATKLGVTIVLICHPSKAERPAPNKEILMDLLKGTSGLKQTAGSVLIHHRPDPKSDLTWIRLAKVRSREHSSSSGGRIKFSFNPKTQTYSEVDGWLDWGHE
jgi:replicative DNA helicase